MGDYKKKHQDNNIFVKNVLILKNPLVFPSFLFILRQVALTVTQRRPVNTPMVP